MRIRAPPGGSKAPSSTALAGCGFMTAAPFSLEGLYGPVNPLGELRWASNRLRSQESFAARDGAENLLSKARRALAADDDRADALIRRACSMPCDDWEGSSPAAQAAVMMLFSLLVDDLEESDEDDPTWLAAVLAAFDAAPVDGRADLQHVLRDIANDYNLNRRESAALRRMIAHLPVDHRPITDLDPAAESLVPRVRALLLICNDFEDALASAGLPGPDQTATGSDSGPRMVPDARRRTRPARRSVGSRCATASNATAVSSRASA